MFTEIQNYLLSLAREIPLEYFIVIGSFLEEIIAPIPSAVIMLTGGAIAIEQSFSYLGLFGLAIIGSFGKTIASYILYLIVDKLEDLIMGKWGKYFGLDHDQIESIGKKFHKGFRDYLTLLWLRALPIVPSTPVTLLSGFFKVNIKAFLFGTFFGTIIRNFIYLYIGFTSLDFIHKFNQGFATSEKIVEIIFVFTLFAVIVYFKIFKKKGNPEKTH